MKNESSNNPQNVPDEITSHAMNLAQTSLNEDWDDESDEHWASFL